MKSTITSRDNAAFKRLCRLSGNARYRRQQGETLLDGVHLAQALEGSQYGPIEFIVSESGLKQPEIAACLSMRPDVPVLILSDGLFRLASPVETPSGLLTRLDLPVPQENPSPSQDSLLVDGVQDPGNLGTLLRTAAASGFRQAILSTDCTQAWSPRALRAGMGAQFRLAVFEAADLCTFLGHFEGLRLVTALNAGTTLFELALQDGPIAWIFGREGEGVRPDVVAHADTAVRIPMPGGQIESLNVAAAAAICLFETVRQRSSSA